MKSRRTFIKSVGTVGTVGLLAGCTGGNSGSGTTAGGGSGGGTTTGGSSGGTTTSGSGGSGETTQTSQPYNDGTVDFNVSPSVAQEDLQAQYTPIKNHLADTLGVEANMRLANSYSAVIQALDSGTSDVAETGPFAAALGAMSDKAEIVLQRKGYGSWTYVSGIATRQGSSISSLSDLEGKTVAFADRLSTSGSLYPLHDIKRQGGLNIGNLPAGNGSNADFEAVFAGSHTASYETLVNGQADAAGMGGFVEGIKDSWSSEAQWLHQHEGLPRAPIVVSPQLSEQEKNDVVNAFLNAPNSIYYGEDGQQDTDDDLWFNDVREAGVDTYQPVIDAANRLGIGTEIFEQASSS